MESGLTVERLKGTRWVLESAWEPIRLLDRLRPLIQDFDGGSRFRIDRESFVILDGVFAPGRLVITEGGGPLRCFGTDSGREVWRYTPPKDSHVLSLAYRCRDDRLFGVAFPYQYRGVRTMLSWHAASGALLYAPRGFAAACSVTSLASGYPLATAAFGVRLGFRVTLVPEQLSARAFGRGSRKPTNGVEV